MPNGRQKENASVQFDFNAVKDLMRCPRSKSELVLEANALVSVDPECRLSYHIRDGIPSMFPDDAAVLTPSEWSAVMARHGRDAQTGERVGENNRTSSQI